MLPAIGLILAVALIVAPAATARLWCETLPPTFLTSVLLAAGATIVLVASAAFTLSLVLAPLVNRRAAA